MPRKGENIYRRKDGRWEGRYVKGRADGKTKYGYVYASTYTEARTKRQEAEKRILKERGMSASGDVRCPDLRFRAVAESWLESMAPRVKTSSTVKYRNILENYIFPRLGGKSVDAITREDVSSFSTMLLLSGGKKENGLAPKTVSDILSVVKSVLEYAAWDGTVQTVGMERFPVKQASKPMRILSQAEQDKFSRFLCGHLSFIHLGILVCLYTGIRIGEVCALKWGDISFEERHLYVRRTMQRLQDRDGDGMRTRILVDVPKSECSIRKIPLPDHIIQLAEPFQCPGDTYFLTGRRKVFVEPRTMENHFKAAIRACGIEDANFHSLRHTFATRCVELGFDIKSLSEILGHANVNITLNRYVHPSMELKKKNMERLSGLFGAG